MDLEITTRLDEEYKKTLEAVSLAVAGSDEAKWQMQKLNELHKQRMDEAKMLNEIISQEDEITESKKDRIVKIVMDGAAILIPTVASCYWMAQGLTFEKTGTFTSRTGQWLSTHFRLFRK